MIGHLLLRPEPVTGRQTHGEGDDRRQGEHWRQHEQYLERPPHFGTLPFDLRFLLGFLLGLRLLLLVHLEDGEDGGGGGLRAGVGVCRVGVRRGTV